MSPSSSDSTLDFVSGAIRTVGRHWTSHWATENPYRPQKSCYWLIIIPLPGDTCRITPPVQGFQNVMSALYQGRHRMSALTHAQCHLRGHCLGLPWTEPMPPDIKKESTKSCLRYYLPSEMKNMPPHLLEDIKTKKLPSFSKNAKVHFLKGYTFVCKDPLCWPCQDHEAISTLALLPFY